MIDTNVFYKYQRPNHFIPNLVFLYLSELNDECSDGKVFIYNRNGQLSSVSVTRKYHENVPVCQILLHANTNHRILAIINYFQRTQQNCESNFLHIGNDEHRPNVLSMTSYRFCNQTVSEEIVSRGNFLWIVYPIATEKNQLRITVTAHEEGNPTDM